MTIFTIFFICNARITNEQQTDLQKKADELVNTEKAWYAYFFDVKGFLDNLTNTIDSELRDKIVETNQQYQTDYKYRMEQLFYLKNVPFHLKKDTIQRNPLEYLTASFSNEGDFDNELLYAILRRGIAQKEAGDEKKLSLIISEFGFGKTSLLLNIFDELYHKNILALFIPLAQIHKTAFSSPLDFSKAVLNLLYNKRTSTDKYIDFDQSDNLFVQLLLAEFLGMLQKRDDIVFMLDGLDENAFAYTHNGLQQIFDCIHQFRPSCYFSLRKEFWDDKQGNFQFALETDEIKQIFLTEWSNSDIQQYLEQYLQNANLSPEEVVSVQKFIKTVKEGDYKKYYGDIPKRPLFLNMLTKDVIRGQLQKRNLSEIYEDYLINKFEIDLTRAFKENTEIKSIALLGQEDTFKILQKIISILVEVSALMVINNEAYDAILLAEIHESKIEERVQLIQLKEISITDILLNSVLIPTAKRSSTENFLVKFAHKSYQEYFTARFLFGLLETPAGSRQDYDLFLYKFESSVEQFLIGLLETEQRKRPNSFEQCINMIGYLGTDKMDVGALGKNLANQYLN